MSRLFATVLFVVLMGCEEKETALNDFYTRYKSAEGSFNLSLGGSFLNNLSGMVQIDELNEEGVKELAEEVKHFNILTIDKVKSSLSEDEVIRLMKDLKDEKYEDLMVIDEKGSSKINIMMKEGDEKIEELVLFINEADSFVLLSLTGSFTKEKVSSLAKMI